MDKLNIFGGTGFIGSNFVKLFPEKSNVIPREDNIPPSGDVLYLISTTHNYHVFDDVHKDIDTNLNKLMDVLPKVDGVFNFISSWFVYGDGYGTRYNPASETSSCNPRGFYSITKRCAEELVESYCRTNDKHFRIIRLCNVIGGDGAAGKKKNALEYLVSRIINNEPIDIYKGENFRNYLHVTDVVHAVDLIQEKGALDSVYNVGSLYSVRLIDVIKHTISKTGSKSVVNMVDAPKFHKIVQAENFFMNCEKLTSLGFVQHYTPFQVVDELIAKHQ